MGLVGPLYVESSRTQNQTTALAGRFFTTEPPGKPYFTIYDAAENENVFLISFWYLF